jgi:predicted small secreted protein
LESRVPRPESARNGRRATDAGKIMDQIIRTKAAALAGFIAIALLAAACNTVEGAGKDTQNLGKDIQNSADKNK